MNDDTIILKRSELEILIAREIAKTTIRPSEQIFYDVRIIKDGIKKVNSEFPDLVEFDKTNRNYGIGAYHEPLLVLFKSKNLFRNYFNYTNPTSGSDPDTLIRKLVLLMFGCKYNKDLEIEEIQKAKEVYLKLSQIFLETYTEHLNDMLGANNE